MQRITVRVKWVDSRGFHLLARHVVLTFADDVATFPLPSNRVLREAFEAQYPHLLARVPTFEARGFTFRMGLSFKREREQL